MTNVNKAHPAYNSAVARAGELARDNPGDCFKVYYDGKAMFVRAGGAPIPPDSELVCIAQRWDDKTVQLRFAGAHSEFVAV